jgi:hypothetical protein
MKKLWILSGIAVAVLAAVIGARMSPEALAVVIGVICGVGASVPVSLLILTFLARKDERRQTAQRDYPPVIVVNSGAPAGAMGQLRSPSFYSSLGGEPARTFHIVGEEDYAATGARGGRP